MILLVALVAMLAGAGRCAERRGIDGRSLAVEGRAFDALEYGRLPLSATDAETEGARTKNRLLAEIASRLAGEFGDVIRLGDYPGYADAGTTEDGIHPNDRGHAALAKAFADVLRPMIAGDCRAD